MNAAQRRKARRQPNREAFKTKLSLAKYQGQTLPAELLKRLATQDDLVKAIINARMGNEKANEKAGSTR